MALPTFSHASATTVSFSRGPTFPHTRAPAYRQTTRRSYAGTTRTATFGDPDTYFPLLWPSLPLADVTALEAFFADVDINASANSFTYTDTDSTAHTVLLEPGSLEITPIAYQLYRVSLVLREVA